VSRAVGVGDVAPDFSLPATGDEEISLSTFAGRPVVIVFYPGDDSPVCTKQLNSYNDGLNEFESLDAQVLAISSQGLVSHEAFSRKYGLNFPLLADSEKQVATAYGVLGPLGFPRRSVFIIDREGVIRYAHRALSGLSYRPVSELVDALNSL
jgi:peroxiredoxin Q/BCP